MWNYGNVFSDASINSYELRVVARGACLSINKFGGLFDAAFFDLLTLGMLFLSMKEDLKHKFYKSALKTIGLERFELASICKKLNKL